MAPGILTAPVVEEQPSKAVSLAQLTEDWDDTIRFYLNGTKVILDNVDPELTLLEYLRGIGLTGTKLGCAEGGCGASYRSCPTSIRQPRRSIMHLSMLAWRR